MWSSSWHQLVLKDWAAAWIFCHRRKCTIHVQLCRCMSTMSFLSYNGCSTAILPSTITWWRKKQSKASWQQCSLLRCVALNRLYMTVSTVLHSLIMKDVYVSCEGRNFGGACLITLSKTAFDIFSIYHPLSFQQRNMLKFGAVEQNLL